MKDRFDIHQASLEDMRLFTDLVTLAGRNPGLNDHETYFKIDPEGYWVGCIDDNPIAFISAISHKTGFGFIGHFFVQPQYRSLGIGRKMMDHAYSCLEGYNICIDAPYGYVEVLKRLGFLEAYMNYRYQGIIGKDGFMHDDMVRLSDIDFSDLVTYDAQCFPVTRIKYLHHWLNQKGAKTLIKVVNNEILGYGLIRPCVEGYKIGPLFADDIVTALEIYDSLTVNLEGNSVYIDVPEINYIATELVSKLEMRDVLQTVRMYNRFNYSVMEEKIFAVTSFELG